MMLLCKLVKGLLYFAIGGGLGHAQYFIIVACLAHCATQKAHLSLNCHPNNTPNPLVHTTKGSQKGKKGGG